MRRCFCLIVLILIFCSAKSQEPDFSKFWNSFTSALEKNNYKSIAEMFNYPFPSHEFSFMIMNFDPEWEPGEGLEKQDVLRYCNQIFTPQFKNAIRIATPERNDELYNADVPQYTVLLETNDEGYSWLTIRLIDGKWKLYNTDSKLEEAPKKETPVENE